MEKEKNILRKFFLWTASNKTAAAIFAIMAALLFVAYAVMIPGLKEVIFSVDGKYPLLNPSALRIGKKDLLVNFQSLRDSLTRKYENRSDFLVSVYFEYLPTGANISINKDDRIWPASLIKIPVAMAMMKKIESGTWKLSNELVILDEDKDPSYGTLYKNPSGTSFPIEKLMRSSLAESDNTAHLVLLRNLESEEIEDIYNHLGLDDIIDDAKKESVTSEADNRITAKRYSVFFRSLYNATYLLPEYSEKFLDMLKEAPRDKLGSGLPEDISFVHKTGIRSEDGVLADAGIVYVPNRPYLITVMLQRKDGGRVSEDDGNVIFRDISEEIYDYVSSFEN